MCHALPRRAIRPARAAAAAAGYRCHVTRQAVGSERARSSGADPITNGLDVEAPVATCNPRASSTQAQRHSTPRCVGLRPRRRELTRFHPRDSEKAKCSRYSITESRVPELIPVLGSQPGGDVSHKPGGRRPLLSARPAVTLATLKTAATNFAAW